MAISEYIFPSNSSEQWPPGQRHHRHISQMIGDLSVKRLWTEGPETWVLILGLWFCLQYEPGLTICSSSSFRPQECELRFSEKQLQAKICKRFIGWDACEGSWEGAREGAKPAVGCRADTCDRKKAGRRIRPQCGSRTVSTR